MMTSAAATAAGQPSHARAFIARLREKELKYRVDESSSDKVVVHLDFTGKNAKNIPVTAIFNRNDTEEIAFRVWDFVHVPKDKADRACRTVNEVNRTYKLCAFTFDEDNGTVDVELDVIVRADSAGAVSYEALTRLVKICDDGYPQLMKYLWN